MRRLLVSTGLAAALAFAACGDDTETKATTSGTGGEGGAVTGGGMGGAPLCGSANGTLDEGALSELAFDDGVAFESVRDNDWGVQVNVIMHELNAEPLWEAVRFELPHPARIHGFKVMWAGLPDGADPESEIRAGLYGDFGYNGFDFWAPDPLWTGTRCAQDVDASGSEWTSYVLDEPITIDHPGLVYVAHLAQPGEPVWWFDQTQQGPEDSPCSVFDDCQSAFNLPEAETALFYNGVSMSFQYHFMVRLYVEYLDDVGPSDTFFQPVVTPASGQHAAWGDYDNDGYDDLLIGASLLHNEGDGSFTPVSLPAGGTSGVWGDYDNDGCLDLFLFAESYSASDTLLKGDCLGTFSDVTAAAGIVDHQTYESCNNPANTASPTASATWVDIDADGWLDLFQANFFCWEKATSYIDNVWRNNGDGTFTLLGATEGFAPIKEPSRTVVALDHDDDGDVDIHVGNYRLRPNKFYDNQGDGTVVERASAIDLDGTPSSGIPAYYGHTIGLAWGDLDNDGDFDNITANLAHPRFFDISDKTQVMINDGSGHYSDLAGLWDKPVSLAGLRYQETHSVPALADFDHDGNLDLALSCIYDGRPSDFYWGNGDGTFRLDAYHAGITTENGWGVALSDHDNDGDVDLFATTLFDNRLADKGHWLQARVVGVSANRAGIGATVRVKTGSVTRMRFVQGGTGKGGQDSLYLHFGLGDATTVDEIRVTFPGGHEVVYPGPIAVDQRVWLVEDSTTAEPGWTQP